MRRKVLSQTGAGSTSPHVPDHHLHPFAIGLGVKVTGTVNYDVEHTFDDPFASGGLSGATWYNHATLVNLTANADSNYAFPVMAIRVTVNSGSGTAELSIIQAGPS